ncbi:MAG: polyprenyl synthetase family protein [Propionibacteriaceae bacterium]|jgi:heptaprenyl diphosphate synthase|nr:polyprenyl synthetase family protein [Propionibacteriaceae bacterium]
MNNNVETVVAELLGEVECRLAEATQAPSPFLADAARHVTLAGGKRFRPLLVILAALLAGADERRTDVLTVLPTPEIGMCGTGLLTADVRKRVVAASAVVELTHVASLYHDDVMDEATLRRGVMSANLHYGNTAAILVGDFLFAQASIIGADLGSEFVALQAATFAQLVQGQIAETRGPTLGEDPLLHYRQVVANKTASLIRTSILFGGMIAGLPEPQLAALERFGEKIGTAFQLADDLIDITSDVAGKDSGLDLRVGLATLPVLLLRESDNPADHALYAKVLQGLSLDETESVVAALRTHPVIAQARAQIVELAESARAELHNLAQCAARDQLCRLCDEAVNRMH